MVDHGSHRQLLVCGTIIDVDGYQDQIGVVERAGRREEGGEPLSQQPPEGVSSSIQQWSSGYYNILYCAPSEITARALPGTVGIREAHDVISL